MSKKGLFVNEDILDNFRFIYFNFTSFTGMCIFITNHQKVMETITWDILYVRVVFKNSVNYELLDYNLN